MEKEALISILESKADKTTSEQFWIVMLVYGLNAFLIHSYKDMGFLADWLVIAFSFLIASWASAYILHRHGTYVELRCEINRIVAGVDHAPGSLKRTAGWGGYQPLGWGFYIAIIWFAAIATLIRYR